MELDLLCYGSLAEPRKSRVLYQEGSHEDCEGAGLTLNWVVKDVDIGEVRELEHLESHLSVGDGIIAQIQVGELIERRQLLVYL